MSPSAPGDSNLEVLLILVICFLPGFIICACDRTSLTSENSQAQQLAEPWINTSMDRVVAVASGDRSEGKRSRKNEPDHFLVS